MRCGGLFETAESNGALRCFFLFSRCDILVVVTRWRECWGDLFPASLDLLHHLRVTYGAAFAEQMAGTVQTSPRVPVWIPVAMIGLKIGRGSRLPSGNNPIEPPGKADFDLTIRQGICKHSLGEVWTVEVGRTIAPRQEQKRPGEGSSANWPFLRKAPCSSLYRPVCGTY